MNQAIFTFNDGKGEIDSTLRESDEDGIFGSFVWDVLALIEWPRTTIGEDWIKPSVKNYWEEQKRRQRGVREKEILYRTLEECESGLA